MIQSTTPNELAELMYDGGGEGLSDAQTVIYMNQVWGDRELLCDALLQESLTADQIEFFSDIFNRCNDKDKEMFLCLFPSVRDFVHEHF